LGRYLASLKEQSNSSDKSGMALREMRRVILVVKEVSATGIIGCAKDGSRHSHASWIGWHRLAQPEVGKRMVERFSARTAVTTAEAGRGVGQLFFRTVVQAKRSRIAICQNETSPQYFQSSRRDASQKISAFENNYKKKKYAACRMM
jgi:hypothetical protein